MLLEKLKSGWERPKINFRQPVEDVLIWPLWQHDAAEITLLGAWRRQRSIGALFRLSQKWTDSDLDVNDLGPCWAWKSRHWTHLQSTIWTFAQFALDRLILRQMISTIYNFTQFTIIYVIPSIDIRPDFVTFGRMHCLEALLQKSALNSKIFLFDLPF